MQLSLLLHIMSLSLYIIYILETEVWLFLLYAARTRMKSIHSNLVTWKHDIEISTSGLTVDWRVKEYIRRGLSKM